MCVLNQHMKRVSHAPWLAKAQLLCMYVVQIALEATLALDFQQIVGTCSQETELATMQPNTPESEENSLL